MSAGWGESEGLLLLELLEAGEIRGPRRRSQAKVWDELVELGWADVPRRRRGLRLREEARPKVERALDHCLPRWRERSERLASTEQAPTPRSWARLLEEEHQAAVDLSDLPSGLNRHTAAALVRRHSKLDVSEPSKLGLPGVTLTSDACLRLRPALGTRLVMNGEHLELDPLVRLAGEVVLPERALLSGARLVGPCSGVVTIENLGAFVDLRAPPELTLVHTPGWDTAMARVALDWWPNAPAWHFGDLDPNGVRILAHLRQARPDLGWLVPDFWQEATERARETSWEAVELPSDSPRWVRELVAAGRWLEQEVVVCDPRWERLWSILSGSRPSRRG